MESKFAVAILNLKKFYLKNVIEDVVLVIATTISMFPHFYRLLLHWGLNPYNYSWSNWVWLYEATLSAQYGYIVIFMNILFIYVWAYCRMSDCIKETNIEH